MISPCEGFKTFSKDDLRKVVVFSLIGMEI